MIAPESNPYRPFDSDGSAPFAGRAEIFSRLRQHLIEPPGAGALVILGRQRVGKTALLRQMASLPDDSVIAAYVPLGAPPASEARFLSLLVTHTVAELTRRDYTLRHVPPLPDDPTELLREWLVASWLPEVCATIRAHRRLLWLVDDAHHLADMVGASPPVDALPAFLFDIQERFAHVRLALAFSDAYETQMPRLAPLAHIERAVRLASLSAGEVGDLLREPVNGLYTVSDEAVAAVVRETGGQPQLAQLAGFNLFRRWSQQPDRETLTADDVRALLPAMVEQADSIFHLMWQESSYNEKLVLMALSGLLYDDPLHPVDAAAIEAWLVETDYPLDTTAIHAAIRALEYREIVSAAPGGLLLRAGLQRAWLLDNARMTTAGAAASAGAAARDRRQGLVVALVIGVIIVGLLIALAVASMPQTGSTDSAPAPTVTLSDSDGD